MVSSVQSLSPVQLWDPKDYRIPAFPVLHYFPEFAQIHIHWGASLAQMVKNLPVMQQTQVQSMGWEDPLERGMATHSSTLSWRIAWREEPGKLQSMRSQRDMTKQHRKRLA